MTFAHNNPLIITNTDPIASSNNKIPFLQCQLANSVQIFRKQHQDRLIQQNHRILQLNFKKANTCRNNQYINYGCAVFYRLIIFSIGQNRKDMRTSPQSLLPKRKPRSVSTFLKKTYELLNDHQNTEIIKWATNGIGFIVVSQETFAKQVLPKYFKHSNYSSFVRQLNMYNFHKIRENNSESYFHHESFDRSNQQKLIDIKRKPQKKKRKNSESDSNLQSDHQEREFSKPILTKRVKEDCKVQKTIQKQVSLQKIEQEKNTRHFVSEQCINIQECQQPQRNMGQNDDDKLSINNDISQRLIPRFATRQLINPSNSNLYPFGVGMGQTSNFCIFY